PLRAGDQRRLDLRPGCHQGHPRAPLRDGQGGPGRLHPGGRGGLGASRVTVNAIAPGGFLTDANRRWLRESPALQKDIEAMIPMGGRGEPRERGPLAAYLASDASSYMTGAVLVIDGGYTLW